MALTSGNRARSGREQLMIALGAFLGGLAALVIAGVFVGRLWRRKSVGTVGETADTGEYIELSLRTASQKSVLSSLLPTGNRRPREDNAHIPYALPADWGNQTGAGFVPPSTIAYLDKDTELPNIPRPAYYYSGRDMFGKGASKPRY